MMPVARGRALWFIGGRALGDAVIRHRFGVCFRRHVDPPRMRSTLMNRATCIQVPMGSAAGSIHLCGGDLNTRRQNCQKPTRPEKRNDDGNADARHRLNNPMPADRSPIRDAALDGKAPRAYALALPPNVAALEQAADAARRLGFDSLLALAANPADPALQAYGHAAVNEFARAAHNQGLIAWTTVSLDRICSDHELVVQSPAKSFGTPPLAQADAIDPRQPVARVRGVVRLRQPWCEVVGKWWLHQLERLRDLGLDGFVLLDSHAAGVALASRLVQVGERIEMFRTASPDSVVEAGNVLLGAESRVRAAPLRAAMAYVGLTADGWAFAEPNDAGLDATVLAVNEALRTRGPGASVRRWTGAGAKLEIISRSTDNGALLLVRNRAPAPAVWPPERLPPLPWQHFTAASGFDMNRMVIAPGDAVLLLARPQPNVVVPPGMKLDAATDPARRVVITRVSPSVDRGAFPAKSVVGDCVAIEADLFADGHEQLAAAVLTRAIDEKGWAIQPMRLVANDVWSASVRFTRLGRHEMVIEAWIDEWGGFTRDLTRKNDAGQDVTLELREARSFIEAAADRARPQTSAQLSATLAALDDADAATSVSIILAEKLATAMAEAADRRFLTRSFVQPIEVEREGARFASWYELFPRSQSQDKKRHGNFSDVIARLPHIVAMGFDTLYFPPIHPIGQRNRKGPNNSLQAAPSDVGSPYAIGSELGGHNAIHPELGTLADFQALIAAAHEQGLDLALDFAIQCAPDHPWLAEHPGWFAWRPDGTVKYAENPPKKYQDIVNVDFYAPDAVPELWEALRDVVLFWIEQGVRTFRVDNPHTKPLPFWQWMIADVKARFPEALFLAEAFTRPKPMYQLAKVGFSQSYTYFTWRNEKAELTSYMNELTQTDVRHFFRPHFFVNTPDINPVFLQTAGRAGFLIRAALAATLSGLWGVYAGFELCEADALPGREEYLDSEKYELRPRPDRAPGDIVDEITHLNHLRRAEPALQSHLGLTFQVVFNDNILYYTKQAPGHSDLLLIAVSLDPHGVQEADFEVPLWHFGLADDGSVDVEDLVRGRHFRWTGKIQHLRLAPDHPYAIWRIMPSAGAVNIV